MDISVSGDETASIFMFRIAAVALHTECGRQTRPCVPGRTTHHTPYKATRLQAVTGRSKARLALGESSVTTVPQWLGYALGWAGAGTALPQTGSGPHSGEKRTGGASDY